MDPRLILGIETSCDDTAAAVVASDRRILSNVVLTQSDLHAGFGGVVPEIAARAHAEAVDVAVERALAEADIPLSALHAVAVTAGPGLIGGLLAGVMCAKGLALGAGLPLIGVNHLAGHALTPRLTDGVEYPYLALLVSGGHCQLLLVTGPEDYARLGGTIDDAPGEAFDKAARLLALPQPGGPAIERAAATGDPGRIPLPRPLIDRPDGQMSFSGLKTALLRARNAAVEAHGGLTATDQADLAAAFQSAVTDVLAAKTRWATRQVPAEVRTLAVVGGVAANRTLRAALEKVAADAGLTFAAPPLALCTDNGAMIAWAGHELHALGRTAGMDLAARPRWPLDTAAAPMLGSGKRGAKA